MSSTLTHCFANLCEDTCMACFPTPLAMGLKKTSIQKLRLHLIVMMNEFWINGQNTRLNELVPDLS